DVLVNARQTDEWRMRVAAREFSGEIGWQPAGKGRIVARLRHLVLPPPTQTLAPVSAARPQAQSESYPALDVVVEDFHYTERSLGRLVLTAIPEGRDGRIERIDRRNPDATLTADGYLQWQEALPLTRMNRRLEVSDIGKFLARMRDPQG